jgi:DNA primase
MVDQVEEIKKKVGIADVVGGFVTLKRAGRNLKGLCPFHEEKTPSFMVNEELSIYKCFGCGESGDIFSFLMKLEGLEFGEALEKLADKAGIQLVKNFQGEEKSEKAKLFEVNNLAAEYYHYLLTEHPAGEVAREYLLGRGVGEKIIKTFKLGFALDEWDGLLTYLVKKKGYKKELLLKAGLIIDSNQGGYDRLRGRVVFPFTDAAGRVVGFSGRIVPALSKGEESGGKYINSPETPVYHKSEVFFGLSQARQAMRKNNRVVVVEGPMDMISSFTVGVTETVAINGTAMTEGMMAILARVCDRLVLALDADRAGEIAIKRSIEAAEKFNLSIKVVNITGGKDPDEVARKDPAGWKKQVEGAVEVYQFVMERAIAKWGSKGAEAMKRVSEEVLPYLAKIGNSVVQAHYVKKLAGVLAVLEEKVWEELAKMGKKEEVGEIRDGERKEIVRRTRREVLGRQLLAMLFLVGEEEIGEVKRMLSGLDLVDSWGKLVVLILKKGKIGKAGEFIKKLPAELAEVAKEAYLMEMGVESVQKEIVKVVEELAKEVIKEERVKLTAELKQKEKEGDKEAVSKLSKRFVSLSYRPS